MSLNCARVTPKVVCTWKLKLDVQTKPFKVKPDLQEVQVSELPRHVAQLAEQETQVKTPDASLPMRAPLCCGMKPMAHIVHMLREIHWAHPLAQEEQIVPLRYLPLRQL